MCNNCTVKSFSKIVRVSNLLLDHCCSFFNLLFIFLVGVCNHFKKDIKGIEAKSKRKHVDIQVGIEMPSWFESSDSYSTVARGDSPEFIGQVRDNVKECLVL